MAITFTNKAAGELKDRLTQMLGAEGSDVWAATFHSSCARILRRDGDRLGYTSHFTIYDTDDSRRLMKAVMQDLDISEKSLSHRAILSEISHAKDELTSPQEYEEAAGEDFRLKLVARAYKAYQRRLEDADAMDFDDLLVNTVRLFQKCPDVLEYYQNRFRYIMVDEYQDTNHAQYEFVNLLAQKSGNLCVVGDDDQSIYKFRGATIENIMNFEEGLPRGQGGALRAELPLHPEHPGRRQRGHRQQHRAQGQDLVDCRRPGEEAGAPHRGKRAGRGRPHRPHHLEGVAAGRSFSDYAILYRMNSQSLTFERMFAKQGVPHRIIGGTRFFDRKRGPGHDRLLKRHQQPRGRDPPAAHRQHPPPGPSGGKEPWTPLPQIAQQVGESLFSVLSHPKDFPAIARAANKLEPFIRLMEEFSEKNQAGELLPSELYGELLLRLGYEDFLKEDEPEKAEDRIENVRELSSMLQRYEEEAGEEASLSGFFGGGLPVYRHRQLRQRRRLRGAHDHPLRQGPGVPGGVPPRLGGGGVPRQRRALRPLPGGGGAPPGLRGHHPGPGGAVPLPRGEPHDLWLHQPQPAVPLRRGDPPGALRALPQPGVRLPHQHGRGLRDHAPQQGAPHPCQRPGQPGGGLCLPGVPAHPGQARPRRHLPGRGHGTAQRPFGTGVILTATPMANDTLLEIAFDKWAPKAVQPISPRSQPRANGPVK